MSNGPIDIVVPWVNPDDEEWKRSFTKWKERETGVRPDCRYRDFGLFQYCVRGALENCPWARNVVVVLASPSQRPEWLIEMENDEPRLRIVYHSDYIPEQFLPTFNSNVIEMFYMMIPGLADNFIAINDDMYITTPTEDTDFFVDDVPVDDCQYLPHERWSGYGYFDMTMRNNHLIAHEYTGKYRYIRDLHVAISHRKPVWLDVWGKYGSKFIRGMKRSRFRQDTNFTHWLFRWVNILSGKFVNRSLNAYESYYVLSDGQRFDRIIKDVFRKKVVCLNDQEALTFDVARVARGLDEIFSTRYSYEKN